MLVAFNFDFSAEFISLIEGSSKNLGTFLLELLSDTEELSSSSSRFSFSNSSHETNLSLGFSYGSTKELVSSNNPLGTIFSTSSEQEF